MASRFGEFRKSTKPSRKSSSELGAGSSMGGGEGGGGRPSGIEISEHATGKFSNGVAQLMENALPLI